MSCKESEIVHLSGCNKCGLQTYSSLPLSMPRLTLFHFNVIYVSSKHLINVYDNLNNIWKEAIETYLNVLLKHCIVVIIFVLTRLDDVGFIYGC
jgi:hypothetical protein